MAAWLKFIPDVLSMIASPIKGWVERKKIRLEHQAKIEEARVNSEIRKIDSDIEIDTINTQNAQSSWKDEYWTIVLSLPAILAFFPDMVPHVRAGFEVLDGMPEWYKYALLASIAAAFGVRQLNNYRSNK